MYIPLVRRLSLMLVWELDLNSKFVAQPWAVSRGTRICVTFTLLKRRHYRFSIFNTNLLAFASLHVMFMHIAWVCVPFSHASSSTLFTFINLFFSIFQTKEIKNHGVIMWSLKWWHILICQYGWWVTINSYN